MRMSDDEVKDRLSKLGGWEREGDALERQFEFANFVSSVEFVNRVVPVAELEPTALALARHLAAIDPVLVRVAGAFRTYVPPTHRGSATP